MIRTSPFKIFILVFFLSLIWLSQLEENNIDLGFDLNAVLTVLVPVFFIIFLGFIIFQKVSNVKKTAFRAKNTLDELKEVHEKMKEHGIYEKLAEEQKKKERKE